MEYRRVYIPGGTYFFTLVTYQRQRIFDNADALSIFLSSYRYTLERKPFETIAGVILPDHMHFIWSLPPNDSNFSTRWRLIKSNFTRKWGNRLTIENNPSEAMRTKSFWQNRFWEHLIRDEQDLINHIEYIHYNPVKHGWVEAPSEWTESSFLKYVQLGYYPMNWAADNSITELKNWLE